MRVPKLAACALTVLAVQELSQKAIASPEVSVPASTSESGNANAPDPKASNEHSSVASVAAVAPPEALEAEESDTEYFVPDPAVADPAVNISTQSNSLTPPQTHSEAVAPPVEAIDEAEQLSLANLKRDLDAIAPARKPALYDESLSDLADMATPELPVDPPHITPADPTLNLTNIATPQLPADVPDIAQDSIEVAQQPEAQIPSTQAPAPSREEPAILRGLPQDFVLPALPEIATDLSITTNTPITDQEFPDPLPRSTVGSLEELARYQEARTLVLNAWAEEVRSCLLDYPRFVRVAPDGTQQSILFDGREGRIVRNANGRLVCRL